MSIGRPFESEPRFPGFDPLAVQRRWDDATRAAVRQHTDPPPVQFFTAAERRAAEALLDRLMGQPPGPGGVHVPLVQLVEARLARDETDGWTYDSMPSDRQAWRRSLAALDADAREVPSECFATLSGRQKDDLIERVRTWPRDLWHGLPPARLWSLWTRYAATAFYSHPAAWAEIGFDGPAYPRGYRNLGIDRLEGIETTDARPEETAG